MEESSRIEKSVIRSLDSLKCCYEWIPVHPDYADTISFCDKYGYDLDHSGGVTPYGLPLSIPIYIDDKIMLLDYVILGAGSRSAKIKVAPESLLNIPTATVITGLSLD